MPKPRFVIDTNTLVSSILIDSSIPDLAVRLIRQSGIILVSITTLEELQGVMNRPKFDKSI
jgi:predicted nucleic acid-binding protein